MNLRRIAPRLAARVYHGRYAGCVLRENAGPAPLRRAGCLTQRREFGFHTPGSSREPAPDDAMMAAQLASRKCSTSCANSDGNSTASRGVAHQHGRVAATIDEHQALLARARRSAIAASSAASGHRPVSDRGADAVYARRRGINALRQLEQTVRPVSAL